MIDYHVHTPLCGHARGQPEQYVEEGVRRGLAEMGFADHFPLKALGYAPRNPVTMEPGDLPAYVENIKRAAAGAPFPVKLGVEVDYLPGKMEAAAGILEKYPFDYVIGSVHFVGTWDCTHPLERQEFQRRPLSELYRDYFELIWEACYSGLFDIMAHVDAIKKFGYRPHPEHLVPLYRKTASVLRETGICLEVNTAGLDAEARELYPSTELLRECLRQGVELTAGSDAHAPAQVARHFPQVRRMLQKEGVDRLVTFTGRQKGYYRLDGGD